MTAGRRIVAILNCDGGTLRSMDTDAFAARLDERWTDAGHSVDVRFVSGSDLTETLDKVGAATTNDTMVVAGGDGTVSAAAGAAWRSGKTLGILPAGTMNLFSRTIGTPLDLDGAIAAIERGRVASCDIATANDRPFVHMFGVGLHPRAMRLRNKLDYNSRYGKMLASARALFKVVKRPLPFRVTITQDGVTYRQKLSALSISNNRLGEGHLPYADRIDEGVLGIYSSEARSPWESTKLLMDIMRGAWSENDTVQKGIAREIRLEFPAMRRNARATIDGEVVALQPEVTLKIYPGELQVLLPPVEQQEDE